MTPWRWAPAERPGQAAGGLGRGSGAQAITLASIGS